MASKFGWKKMRTTQERREVGTCPVKVRAKRNLASLPSYYDDKPMGRQPRSDRYKSHRRKTNAVILAIIL